MSVHDVLPAARTPQDAERTPARVRANGDQDRKDFRDWVEKDVHLPDPKLVHPQVEKTLKAPAAYAPFRAVADHAVEISVLYEWQATPGYALSQLSRLRGLAPMPVSLQAAQQIAARAELTPFRTPESVPAAAGALPEAAALSAAVVGACLVRAAHPTDASTVSASADRAAVASATERWSDRSVKRVLDTEGTMTIWVRDYRMSGSDTGVLVDALLSDTANSAAQRIMFNGAEIWRRPTTRQGDSNGN
ncbi:hypothetical protein LL974_03215 [Xanthomonas campestris pv. cannae]|nr:hypothetical protein [Xanthomonas campestris pv. cannae]